MSNRPMTFEKFGAKLVPDDERDYRVSALIGGEAGALPTDYVVPQYRHLFDEDFKPNYEELRKVISHQMYDDCVAHAYRYQEGEPENGRMPSARDNWRQAKRLDGYPMSSFGTTLNASQDAGVAGTATESTVPYGKMSRDELLSVDDVNEEVLADREANRNKSYFSAYRNEFRRTIFNTHKPVQTSYMYHTGDRDMRTNGGIMGRATGQAISGHSQTMFGWLGEMDLFFQSWGTAWGDCGLMHVPHDITLERFSSGRIAVDLPKDLAKLLHKWNGKNVFIEGSPDIYRCELGVLRKYPDEITWWAFGNLFNVDVNEIPPDEFALIPKGADMSIDDAPYRSRELVRQIRQYYKLS